MKPDRDTALCDFVIRSQGAIPILEAAGIDYYCDGHRSLAEACASAKLDVEGLLARLTTGTQNAPPPDPDWRDGSLVALLAHVDQRFHGAHVEALAAVLAAFGAATRECSEVCVTALEPILRALETTADAHHETAASLFADVMALEAGASLSQMLLPALPRVVHDLKAQHVRTRSLLAAARRITGEYHAPSPRMAAVEELYRQLAAWELEAHGHAHLENNVLLPWSVEIDPAANRHASWFKGDPAAAIVFPQGTP
jgi:regulator of cell morphogenesis and NO signaling